MEVYILVISTIWLVSLLLIIVYFNKIGFEHYEYILLITTDNCANVCEGVLREALCFVKKMGNYQIVVVDMHSQDQTYEILKRLSLKYIFPLLSRTQKQFDKNEILQELDISKKYNLLVLTKDTTYFKANTEMKRIRHSSTYNTSFH
ncbi:MAG: hypothetical protein APF76_02555 [Desulfitibacter sp. BRH_c19]|nr:MAG: hypothetical protein APF76_02555 [Desulfitibacter sp. BRH_c19]